MPSKGRAHSKSYTDHNRVKHAILTKYLRAYLQALSKTVEAFHYIDGFAGAGTYGAEHPGSPLYAVELLAKYPNRGVASFVETDPVSRTSLTEAIEQSPFVRQLAEAPVVRHTSFSDALDEVLGRPVLNRFRRVATFAFVDPCGLKDLYIEDLAKILRRPFAECLVFLNYDGLPRWLGGVHSGTHERARLDRFFGASDLAAEALASFQSSAPTREPRLLDTYIKALQRESGATFVLAFRFKAADRNRTSHYLIHLSQHPLAFKIMKGVMRSESSDPKDLGAFGFIPEDELASQGKLFSPNAERAGQEILSRSRPAVGATVSRRVAAAPDRYAHT